MISKSKVFKIPTRTADFKLNCTVMSNPLSQIFWLFLPNQQLLTRRNNNENIINYTSQNNNWILLESKHLIKHTLSLNSDTILYRLPHETKHQHEIYEKIVQPFYLTSILYIRVNFFCFFSSFIYLNVYSNCLVY